MSKQVKDYYTILELSPVATLAEIKSSYRKLAFKYHPDTNPENSFAAAMFLEVQEAYNILSDNGKRRLYDEERWLSGMDNRARGAGKISPAWILNECRRLSTHMRAIDTFRMDHRALHDYIQLLLSDINMAILQASPDNSVNTAIAQHILLASKDIKYTYIHNIAGRISLLCADEPVLIQQVQDWVRRSEQQERLRKWQPMAIVLITLMLCVLMYLWVRLRN